MKKNSTHLFNILKKLQVSSLDRKEVNYLIEKSYKISFSFIRSKQGLKLNNYIDEITSLEDLAMDAIVPLFVKNSAGELGIHRSLINWNDSLNTEADADYFL